MTRTSSRTFPLLAISLALISGCTSSLVTSDDPLGVPLADAGIMPEEAPDRRRIPSTCRSAADCADEDPCTLESCVEGDCVFDPKGVDLLATEINTPDPAVDVALRDGRLFVAMKTSLVRALDVSDPLNPSLIRDITLEDSAKALAVDANEWGIAVALGKKGIQTFSTPDLVLRTYVKAGENALTDVEEVVGIGLGPNFSVAASNRDGFVVIDLKSLGNLVEVKTIETSGRSLTGASSITSGGIVADSLGGGLVVAYKTEEGPAVSGRITSDGRVVDVAMSGDTTLIAEYGAGYGVADLSHPSEPARLVTVRRRSPVTAVTMMGPQTGVIAEEDGRLSVVDLRDPKLPGYHAVVKTSSPALALDSHGGMIAAALGDDGVVIYRTGCLPD